MSNLIRFGLLSLNLETGDLQGSRRGVRLPEQQCMILQLLLAHDGGVVSREEIRSRLWPGDTIVEFDRSIMQRFSSSARLYAIPPTKAYTSKP
jgi:DNA-binding winged helix-turn-helix (wHTH) protein